MTIIDEWVQKVSVNSAIILESRIRILLKPKPKWMTKGLWERLLKMMLCVEVSR